MIAIIGTVGVPACYGGFETLVDNLLDDESDYIVYCSTKAYKEKLKTYKSARLVYLPLDANGVSSIFYDALAIMHALFFGYKTFLVLGVSAGFMLPILRLFSGRKLVTNIDGLEWRRNKWNKWARWYLKWSEKLAVKYSHVVIADNQGIADYVKNEYGVDAEVIAYGGDHVLTREPCGGKGGYAFSVCRIEPENNVHVIFDAFSRTDKKLKFVGNWNSSEYGRGLKRQYSSFMNLEIIDPIYDLDQLFYLRDGCDFYVHGHSAGGTNPSLVEAMFFSKAVFAFDCVYNRYTMDQNGCYFSDLSSLIGLLSAIDQLSLDKIGSELKKIADRNYTWDVIRDSYAKLLAPL